MNRALVALLLLAMACALSVGSVPLAWRDVLEGNPVFFTIRLPRVVLGVLIGGGLGVSGAATQGIFRNPLVDPGLLGVSSGAGLGAAAAIVLGARMGLANVSWFLPIAAFGAAAAAMQLVIRIARSDGRTGTATLILAGVAVNALASAQIGLLTYLARDAQLRTLTFWTLGSLGSATWPAVGISAVFMVAPIALLLRSGRALNVLLLGEAEASSLGVAPEGVRRTVLLLVTLTVGASVAVAGILAFVGLVVPHLVRMLVGADHRRLLPASAPLGAALLTLADALARTVVSPAELPLGIVTACVGAPFFLLLLTRERRRLA